MFNIYEHEFRVLLVLGELLTSCTVSLQVLVLLIFVVCCVVVFMCRWHLRNLARITIFFILLLFVRCIVLSVMYINVFVESDVFVLSSLHLLKMGE